MLNRIPFWGWFILILVTLYSVYNPLGFHLVNMWAQYDPIDYLPLKVLATLIALSFIGLVIHGYINSTSFLGFIIMILLVTSTIWSIYYIVDFNILSLTLWAWIGQPILAAILTVGWQWPKIWRRSTGAVSVNDPDTPV